MKKIILVFGVLLLMVTSCRNPHEVAKVEAYPMYELDSDYMVPDSSKPAMAKWVTETVKGVSYKMSTHDYEDPEDLVDEATEEGIRIFSVRVEGLTKYDDSHDEVNGYGTFIPEYNLSSEELKLFHSLRNKPLNTANIRPYKRH